MTPRVGITAFAAGIGFGIGYQDCSHKFEKGLLLYRNNAKIVAEVEVPTTTKEEVTTEQKQE